MFQQKKKKFNVRWIMLTLCILFAAVLSQSQMAFAANTNIDSAIKVSFGNAYSDSITTNISKRYYKITLPSSGNVSFDIKGENKYLNFYLYNAAGKEIDEIEKSKSSVTDKTSIQTSYDLTGGTYYFAIEGGGWEIATGTYQYQVNFISANESFPETGEGNNNKIDSANRIAIGKSYNGQIAITDSIDYYVFTIPSSGKVTFNVEGDNDILYMYLYDSTGKELESARERKSSVTNKVMIEESYHITGGTYYLAIDGDNDNWFIDIKSGNYQFILSFISANESFKETHIDDYISGANQINYNTNYRGQIAINNDDTDYYKFTVKKKDRIEIMVSSDKSGSADIYNVKGENLWSKSIYYDEQSGKGVLSHIVEISPGTYYLCINCNYSDGENYSFKIASYNATKKPEKVTLSSVKSSKKKTAVVKWKRITDVSGYQIQYAKSKKMNGSKTVNVGKNTAKKTIKKLSSKRKYYVRVRAYKTVAGKKKYGSWSKVKSAKVR